MAENQTRQEVDAEAQSDALNANLLASEQERNYASLQSKHESLSKTCSNQESQLSALQSKITELQSQVSAKDATLALAVEKAESEGKRACKSEEREKDVSERMARVDVEADSLRQEMR